MKLVIGGSIAIIIGVYGLATNFGAFLSVLAAIIPIILILGGCLAIYLNHETDSQDVEEIIVDQDNIIIPKTPSNHDSPETESNPAETEPESKPVSEEISTDTPADKTPELIGNTSSLVFHNSDCKFSKSENCTAFFNTREKAIQEGYKPCGICKP